MEYKYTVLTNTTIGTFMALLDSNIVLISLPTIIRDLPGTSTFDGIWIIMGYILISATLLLTIGRLGDIFGKVRLYNLGFGVFTVGSGLCSISTNGTALVAFRLVQGIGGALIFANNAAILTDAFPITERGRALGINQVFGVTGAVVGLVAGGVLTSTLGWRSIFWINIPVGVFATTWAFTKLKEVRGRSRKERLDLIGNALFAVGLSVFLLGLTFGAISGWAQSDIALMTAGVISLALFAYAETRVASPMMDMRLFRVRAFSTGVLSNLLAATARGAVSLVLVFYFQGALGLDPLTAGILLIPLSLAIVSAGPLSGYLSDKYGSGVFSTGGLAISTVGLAWFSLLPLDAPYPVLVVPMVITGVGAGMFIAPNIASIMNSVTLDRRGIASGMSSIMLSTGFLLSLGLSFAIMAGSIPLEVLRDVFAGLPVQGGQLNLLFFAGSMHKIFAVMAVISLVAAVASYSGHRKGATGGATARETIN